MPWSSRLRPLIAPTVVGIVAALISLGRLWLGNHDALTEVVWAEDGVFPMCIEKAGFLRCLVDPFAGYLLVLPRLLAGVVALFPATSWALVTNLLAALVAGMTGGVAFAVARRARLGTRAATLLGVIPVLLPIVGLEAINAVGSSYMLLLYLVVLVLTLPSPQPWSTAQMWWIGALLLVAALTIPTVGIAIALIVVQAARRTLALRTAVVWSALVVVGLLAQILTAVNATRPREIAPGLDSLEAWVDQVPVAVATMWPGFGFSQFVWDGAYLITWSPFSAVIVTGALAAVGVVFSLRRDDRRSAIGLLVLAGLVIGAVPSVIGVPNNRYYVVPMMLWTAALVVALDPWLRRTSALALAPLAALVLVIWWPLMPASGYRSTPAPPWHEEIARVEAACKADPQRMERVVFSPYWPPNWGDALSEPTHPDIACFDVWTWLGIASQK